MLKVKRILTQYLFLDSYESEACIQPNTISWGNLYFSAQLPIRVLT